MKMRRMLIEHIPSGKKWESDWVETEFVVSNDIEYKANVSHGVLFPYGGIDIFIPPSIMDNCVVIFEYKEE